MTKSLGKKVCIVVDSLSEGGAEKMAANLSKILEVHGHKVVLVSLQNCINYKHGGRLINLGENESAFRRFRQLKKLLQFRKHIKNFRPDLIVDYRVRNRWVMECFLYYFVLKGNKLVYTVHSHHTDYHFPGGKLFKTIYNKSIVVGVSKEILKRLKSKYHFQNLHYIPNAIDFEHIKSEGEKFNINYNFILAVGRLDNSVKQFDKLITCYSQTNLVRKNIKLCILGDGKDYENLEKLIKNLNLTNYVELLGFKSNPYVYLKNAKFLVLSSKFEGLPMVILEAFALQTPVVSFNCQSGPDELILHNENGFLIEDQNFDELLKSLNFLSEKPEILEAMRLQTLKNLDPYLLKSHYKYWKPLLYDIN